MGLNVGLLRESFELVIERAPNLTHRFYGILFSRYPQVKPLFGRNSQEQQEKMLTEALAAVIDRLEDASWLEEKLMAMGAKDVDYVRRGRDVPLGRRRADLRDGRCRGRGLVPGAPGGLDRRALGAIASLMAARCEGVRRREAHAPPPAAHAGAARRRAPSTLSPAEPARRPAASLSHRLHDDALAPAAIELRVEDLLPGPEIELPRGDGHDHLVVHEDRFEWASPLSSPVLWCL